VSALGKVTAKKVGKATITAKVGTKSFTCKVTVKPLKVTVKFNPNGGALSQGAATSKKINSGSAYGSLPNANRTGYAITGWYTEASGGTLITKSSIVEAKSPITLYAHWIIKFDIKSSVLNKIGMTLGNLKKGNEKLAYIVVPPEKTIPYKGNYLYKSYYSVGGAKSWYAIESMFPFSNPADISENSDSKISYVGGLAGTLIPELKAKGKIPRNDFVKALGAKVTKYYNDPASDYAGVLDINYKNKYSIKILCGVNAKNIKSSNVIEIHKLK
jgi:uncharacterized repeat protein (TIGR02543 family)